MSVTTEYKGYTIEEEYGPYCNKPHYIYYPTDEGRQDDYDGDSEGWHYCGNAFMAWDLEEAKGDIDEIILNYKSKKS
jgi:hypothetical protein